MSPPHRQSCHGSAHRPRTTRLHTSSGFPAESTEHVPPYSVTYSNESLIGPLPHLLGSNSCSLIQWCWGPQEISQAQRTSPAQSRFAAVTTSRLRGYLCHDRRE